MRLDLLAHEERLDVGAAGERGARDRIGAHRHPADRGRVPGAGLVGDELGEREEAGRPEDRALGVDQVLRGPPARQHDLADHERVLAQLGEQSLAGGRPCVEAHRPASS